jgi:hypothetical protein
VRSPAPLLPPPGRRWRPIQPDAIPTPANHDEDDGGKAAGTEPSTIPTPANRDEDDGGKAVGMQPDAIPTLADHGKDNGGKPAGAQPGAIPILTVQVDGGGAAGMPPGAISTPQMTLKTTVSRLPACSLVTPPLPRTAHQQRWAGRWQAALLHLHFHERHRQGGRDCRHESCGIFVLRDVLKTMESRSGCASRRIVHLHKPYQR